MELDSNPVFLALGLCFPHHFSLQPLVNSAHVLRYGGTSQSSWVWWPRKADLLCTEYHLVHFGLFLQFLALCYENST